MLGEESSPHYKKRREALPRPFLLTDQSHREKGRKTCGSQGTGENHCDWDQGKKTNQNPLRLGEEQETLSCKEPAKITGRVLLPQGGTGSLRKSKSPETQDTGPARTKAGPGQQKTLPNPPLQDSKTQEWGKRKAAFPWQKGKSVLRDPSPVQAHREGWKLRME